MGLCALVGACGDVAGDGDASTTTSEGSTASVSATGTGESTTGVADTGTSNGSAATSSTSIADTSTAGEVGGSTQAVDTTGGERLSFVAVTFNTGGHADGEDDVADEWYGNGLSWIPAVEQTQAFFADLQPDVVVFQEVFHSPDCAEIPVEYHEGYVCESWSEGDPTVAQVILGAGYQVACHLGKTDKCAAVKQTFGTFVGCDSDFCLDGLAGGEVEGCGSGSRIGRGVIQLTAGGTLTVVNVHGTSGFLPADQLCRVAQIDQVFVDLDGEPAANGVLDLVLGDFNTDPGRAAFTDLSAARWNDFVGDDLPFHFVTDVGPDAQPTYAGLVNIDHQVSDALTGTCWHPGITAGTDPVVDFDYFDHVPAVCDLTLR